MDITFQSKEAFILYQTDYDVCPRMTSMFVTTTTNNNNNNSNNNNNNNTINNKITTTILTKHNIIYYTPLNTSMPFKYERKTKIVYSDILFVKNPKSYILVSAFLMPYFHKTCYYSKGIVWYVLQICMPVDICGFGVTTRIRIKLWREIYRIILCRQVGLTSCTITTVFTLHSKEVLFY